MNQRLFIPADPDQRRLLWREWIHSDAPRSHTQVRRAPHREAHAQPGTDWLPDVIDAPTGVIHGLKTAIAECLVGATLPIADRERLIARSIKLGLSRFEANLLIAAVQNRHRESPAAFTELVPRQAPRLSLGAMLVVILVAELLAGIIFLRFFF